MLTNKLRPNVWGDVAGQKENIKILKVIAKDPENSPRTIILEGSYGCGKTSCARILAKEVNGVKDPNYDLNSSPFYYEYDSTVIGNVQEIRKLRDSFGSSFGGYWKIVVFDECHSVSQQAQTALLKILEEGYENTIFCLCTTHVHKLLPTIRSRSLELRFDKVPYEEVVEHLNVVEEKLGISVPSDIKKSIAYRSYGHMRNAHMLVDKFLMLGEDGFRDSVVFSMGLICEYFREIRSGNVERVMKIGNELLEIPLDEVKFDFSVFVLEGLKSLYGSSDVEGNISEVVKIYGSDFMKIVGYFFSDWFGRIFDTDVHFKCGLVYFYDVLRNSMPNVSSNSNNSNNSTNIVSSRGNSRRL